MREIKFRGKDIKTGEWVFGDLHTLCDKPHIHTDKSKFPYAGKRSFVIPETIGQFTGFFDKNGKEIYEGDILDVTVFDCFDNDRQYRVYVGWIGSEFMGIDVKDSDSEWNLCWLCNQDEEIEVIGNIHDNPELINK